jgi:hypothetical protein
MYAGSYSERSAVAHAAVAGVSEESFWGEYSNMGTEGNEAQYA